MTVLFSDSVIKIFWGSLQKRTDSEDGKGAKLRDRHAKESQAVIKRAFRLSGGAWMGCKEELLFYKVIPNSKKLAENVELKQQSTPLGQTQRMLSAVYISNKMYRDSHNIVNT